MDACAEDGQLSNNLDGADGAEERCRQDDWTLRCLVRETFSCLPAWGPVLLFYDAGALYPSRLPPRIVTLHESAHSCPMTSATRRGAYAAKDDLPNDA